jgi:hypothetical protein
MFQAKEEELTLKYEKIKSLKDELKSFKEDQGMGKPIRYMQPLITTSFMNRKPSQSGKTERSEVSFEQLNKIRLTQGNWKGASQSRVGKTALKDQKSKLADLASVV